MIGLAWVPLATEPGFYYKFPYRPMPDFAERSLASPVSVPCLSPNSTAIRSSSLSGAYESDIPVMMYIFSALVGFLNAILHGQDQDWCRRVRPWTILHQTVRKCPEDHKGMSGVSVKELLLAKYGTC